MPSRADFVIGITTRLDSPITKGLESLDVRHSHKLLVCPYQHPTLPTLVINKENTYIRDNTEEDLTFHEFEVSVLKAFLYVIPTMLAKLKII